jgi:hypothetical protein
MQDFICCIEVPNALLALDVKTLYKYLNDRLRCLNTVNPEPDFRHSLGQGPAEAGTQNAAPRCPKHVNISTIDCLDTS